MKKEKTLSEKTHQFEDLEEWVYLKDVKQFIKDILDEIFLLINAEHMKIDTISYLQHLEEIINQKAGFEELE